MVEVTKALDLGSGRNMRNWYNADEIFGVDLIPSDDDNIKQADLILDGIPWEDSTFDFVTAIDFLEHIPRLLYVDGVRREPFVELMHDIHRVLKPNGLFYAVTPSFPHPQAFQDPTHVNIISWNTLYYFTGQFDEHMTGPGFSGKFEEAVPQGKYDEAWLVWELRALK